MLFKELEIGDKFTIGETTYEKITPIKKSCCSSFTAKKLPENINEVISPDTEVLKITQDI